MLGVVFYSVNFFTIGVRNNSLKKTNLSPVDYIDFSKLNYKDIFLPPIFFCHILRVQNFLFGNDLD